MSDLEISKFYQKVLVINTHLLNQAKEGEFLIKSLQESSYIHTISDLSDISIKLVGIVSGFEEGNINNIEALDMLREIEDSLKPISVFELIDDQNAKLEPQQEQKESFFDEDDFL